MGRWNCFRDESEIILAYIYVAHRRIRLVDEGSDRRREERGEYHLGLIGDCGCIDVQLGDGYCDVIFRLSGSYGNCGNGRGVIKDKRAYLDVVPVCKKNEI